MTKAEAIKVVRSTIEDAKRKRDLHSEPCNYELEWRDWEGYVSGAEMALNWIELITIEK